MNLSSKIVLLFVITIQILFYSGCSGDEKQEVSSAPVDVSGTDKKETGQIFRSVPGAEARMIIEKNKDLLLLDVRTPQERHQVRIAGSYLVPIGNVMRGKIQVSRQQPVMLLCAVGGRSYVAAKVLSKMGYREVYNLEGGIEAWRRAGLPVEYGPEAPKKPVAETETKHQ